MGVYHGPVCRLCRREGVKLNLKGNRCESAKCPFEGSKQKTYPPGMHPWKRQRQSEYRPRLREKQKFKRTYGIREKQLKRYFREAERLKGNTGANLVQLLERRLDNVVYRSGLAMSPGHARQMISHGHILLNGRKVDVSSVRVSVNDVITLKDSERIRGLIKAQREENKRINVPSWLSVTGDPPQVQVTQTPDTTETLVEFSVQLVVEFCSR